MSKNYIINASRLWRLKRDNGTIIGERWRHSRNIFDICQWQALSTYNYSFHNSNRTEKESARKCYKIIYIFYCSFLHGRKKQKNHTQNFITLEIAKWICKQCLQTIVLKIYFSYFSYFLTFYLIKFN